MGVLGRDAYVQVMTMTMPRRIIRFRSCAYLVSTLALGVLLIAGSAACSGPSVKHRAEHGAISGMATPCVGAAKPGQASVTIYARRGGRVVASRRVVLTKPPGNPYRMMLAPGTYVISAPASGLAARKVAIRAGLTVTINFLPSCK